MVPPFAVSVRQRELTLLLPSASCYVPLASQAGLQRQRGCPEVLPETIKSRLVRGKRALSRKLSTSAALAAVPGKTPSPVLERNLGDVALVHVSSHSSVKA